MTIIKLSIVVYVPRGEKISNVGTSSSKGGGDDRDECLYVRKLNLSVLVLYTRITRGKIVYSVTQNTHFIKAFFTFCIS
jgi:hypothetical protein